MTVRCSAADCEAPAVETLYLRAQYGHVHDCGPHAALLREWCDVTHGRPFVDGECVVVGCTPKPVWTGKPVALP